MVPRGRNMVQGCLHMGDVMLSGDIISLSFRWFKHSTRQGPQSLHVKGECIPGSLINLAFFREFQSARGEVPSILFLYPDGSPMLRPDFDVSLKRLLEFCGYQTSAFKGHSFCIWGSYSKLH